MRFVLPSLLAFSLLGSVVARADDAAAPGTEETPPSPNTKDMPDPNKMMPEGGEATPTKKPVDSDARPHKDEPADVHIVIDDPNKVYWGLGVRARGLIEPKFLLDLFLDSNTGNVTSSGFALEGVRRRKHFDIVGSFEYSSIQPSDGNFLGKGDDPSTADWTTFKNFGLASVNVSFLWHSQLSKIVALRYGAGLGIGFVLGDVLRQGSQGCTSANLSDPSQCHPPTAVCTRAGCSPQSIESARGVNPIVKAANAGVPPVVPIINMQLGARFTINPHFSVNLDGGFRDIFYLGVGTDYFF